MTNISSSAIDSQQKLFQNFSSLISLSREQESVIGSLKEELAEQKSLLASANSQMGELKAQMGEMKAMVVKLILPSAGGPTQNAATAVEKLDSTPEEDAAAAALKNIPRAVEDVERLRRAIDSENEERQEELLKIEARIKKFAQAAEEAARAAGDSLAAVTSATASAITTLESTARPISRIITRSTSSIDVGLIGARVVDEMVSMDAEDESNGSPFSADAREQRARVVFNDELGPDLSEQIALGGGGGRVQRALKAIVDKAKDGIEALQEAAVVQLSQVFEGLEKEV